MSRQDMSLRLKAVEAFIEEPTTNTPTAPEPHIQVAPAAPVSASSLEVTCLAWLEQTLDNRRAA
jgi:hypothetical protein